MTLQPTLSCWTDCLSALDLLLDTKAFSTPNSFASLFIGEARGAGEWQSSGWAMAVAPSSPPAASTPSVATSPVTTPAEYCFRLLQRPPHLVPRTPELVAIQTEYKKVLQTSGSFFKSLIAELLIAQVKQPCHACNTSFFQPEDHIAFALEHVQKVRQVK